MQHQKFQEKNELVANALETLQHLACAFTTKIVGVRYKNNDRLQHNKFREKKQTCRKLPGNLTTSRVCLHNKIHRSYKINERRKHR
jgi:hypothetical protein